eukprot:gene29538-5886_t
MLAAKDGSELGIPNYFTIVKEPVDLNTIVSAIHSGAYSHFSQVYHHVLLVFTNAMRYNPPGNTIHQLALKVRTSFASRAMIFMHQLQGLQVKCEAEPAMWPPPASRFPLAPMPEASASLELAIVLHLQELDAAVRQRPSPAAVPITLVPNAPVCEAAPAPVRESAAPVCEAAPVPVWESTAPVRKASVRQRPSPAAVPTPLVPNAPVCEAAPAPVREAALVPVWESTAPVRKAAVRQRPSPAAVPVPLVPNAPICEAAPAPVRESAAPVCEAAPVPVWESTAPVRKAAVRQRPSPAAVPTPLVPNAPDCEAAPAPVRESAAPVCEAATAPVCETAPAPVCETAPAPVREAAAPVCEAAPAPVRESTAPVCKAAVRQRPSPAAVPITLVPNAPDCEAAPAPVRESAAPVCEAAPAPVQESAAPFPHSPSPLQTDTKPSNSVDVRARSPSPHPIKRAGIRRRSSCNPGRSSGSIPPTNVLAHSSSPLSPDTKPSTSGDVRARSPSPLPFQRSGIRRRSSCNPKQSSTSASPSDVQAHSPSPLQTDTKPSTSGDVRADSPSPLPFQRSGIRRRSSCNPKRSSTSASPSDVQAHSPSPLPPFLQQSLAGGSCDSHSSGPPKPGRAGTNAAGASASTRPVPEKPATLRLSHLRCSSRTSSLLAAVTVTQPAPLNLGGRGPMQLGLLQAPG